MKTKVLIGVILVLVAIQFVPVKKNTEDNYVSSFEVKGDTQEAKDVLHILETACYDCHSNQTVYPWYNKIAPVSWYLAKHVNNGKKHLNFDAWNDYDQDKREHKSEEIVELIEEDEMPLFSYTLLHSEAKLSEQQKELLIRYFSNTP